jgi:ATP-binding cassette subfamily C protein
VQLQLVTLKNGWHKSDGGTLIGYSEESGEPVALIPVSPSRYRLFSVSCPLGAEASDAAAAKIRRDAFICRAGFPSKKLGATDVTAFMLRRSWGNDWKLVWCLSLVAGLIALLLPVITSSIFGDVIPIDDRQALGTVVQVMLVSGFAVTAMNFTRAIAFLRIKTHASVAVESALWSRLLSLPTEFFRKYQAGDIVSRMQGVESISSQLDNSVLSTMFGFMFSFWSLFLMFWYSARATLFASVVWCVYLLISAFIYKKTVFCAREKIKKRNAALSMTVQLLNGIAKFKQSGEENQAFYLWSKAFGGEWFWNLKIRWWQNWLTLVNTMQPVLLSMLVFYVTEMSFQVQPSASPMSYTQFLGFQTALAGFNASLTQLVPCLANMYLSLAQAENLAPILNAEPEVTEDKIDAGRLEGGIEVNNLSFAYGPDMPLILNDVSFSVKPGESVAFTGRSGCGKSTLMRLLLGFEKPLRGFVYYDSRDLASLNVKSVRSQMGVVLQNGMILPGSIFINIVGSLPLTLDDAWEAARMASLEEDIRNMPMGMHTFISEGASNISGGQRQRIMIARSIVHKPRIVIMDEATSSLDNRTQAIVTESLRNMGCTRIVVAQRLSTVRNMDKIFVLENGRIAEEGNFGQLMEKGGLFAALAKRQLT